MKMAERTLMLKDGCEEDMKIAEGGRNEMVLVASSPFRLARYQILASPSHTHRDGRHEFSSPHRAKKPGLGVNSSWSEICPL